MYNVYIYSFIWRTASIIEYKYTRARLKHINMWNITQNNWLTRCQFIDDCIDNTIIIYYRIMDYDRYIGNYCTKRFLQKLVKWTKYISNVYDSKSTTLS